MEERFNSMQSQMQDLISSLGSMDQLSKNSFAKQLFVNVLMEYTKEINLQRRTNFRESISF